MQKKDKTIAILTLGCAKNTVDSEIIASILQNAGVIVEDNPENATVVVINTCGFIEDSKQESIDTILNIADMKDSGHVNTLIVCGCLSKRYEYELAGQLPEIDVLSGIDAHETARKVIDILGIKNAGCLTAKLRKHRLTPRHWAYLRIAEGCDNRCTYCAIPLIRGPLTSRSEEAIVREAVGLVEDGALELNVIAQDTTSYNRDKGAPRLHLLLQRLCAELPDTWIRLLYTHPAHYYDELIDVLASEAQICPYLDLPLQHINDRVLSDMGRKATRERVEELINTLRTAIPSLTLRTTCIVGFPSETEAAFEELMEFVKEYKFERLGAFIYSPEEDTSAAELSDTVPQKLKIDRYNRLMSLQQEIAGQTARERIGSIENVLVENSSSENKGLWTARSRHEAPEVDPIIYVEHAKGIRQGDKISVRILDSNGLDFSARFLKKA